jgi:hypothetical protein
MRIGILLRVETASEEAVSMGRLGKHPTAIWAGVLWIGGLGVLIGSVIFSTFGVASGATSGDRGVTANQGAAGTAPWPVIASQSGIWNIGITSLPALAAGNNVIGKVQAALPDHAFNFQTDSATPSTVASGSASTTYAISNLSGTDLGSGGGFAIVDAIYPQVTSDGTCTIPAGNFASFSLTIRIPPGASYQQTFPQPLVLRAQPLPAGCSAPQGTALQIQSLSGVVATVIGYTDG